MAIESPKYKTLVPKHIRRIIFVSPFWREHCQGMTMETLGDLARKVTYCGGVFDDKPTPFVCLLLKLLMMKSDYGIRFVGDLMKDFRSSNRYALALGALYVRLIGVDVEVYYHLERCSADTRELRIKAENGTFIWSRVDVFMEDLLSKDNSCSIPLQPLKKRWIFEAIGDLRPRKRYPEFDIAKKAELDSGGNYQSDCIAIGIKTNEGVIIAAEKMFTLPLLEYLCVGKIMIIDEHIGCAMSGSIATARIIIPGLQFLSQQHRYSYGEPAAIELATEEFVSYAVLLSKTDDPGSMSGPFDVSLLIGGVDENGPSLFYTDSSGKYQSCNAKAIGAGSEDADRSLQEQFKEDLTLKEAEIMAISILKQFIKGEVTSNNVAIAKISPIYHLYTTSEVEAVITFLQMRRCDPSTET